MCGWDIQKVDKKYTLAPRPKAKQVILHNLRYLTEILIYSQHHWHLLWPQHNKQLILQIKLTLHYWLRCKTHRWRGKEVWEIRRYEQKQETENATRPLQKIITGEKEKNQNTLARLAVKSTHSKSSPIFWRNSSTWGLFSTYTCKTLGSGEDEGGQRWWTTKVKLKHKNKTFQWWKCSWLVAAIQCK